MAKKNEELIRAQIEDLEVITDHWLDADRSTADVGVAREGFWYALGALRALRWSREGGSSPASISRDKFRTAGVTPPQVRESSSDGGPK